MRERMAQHRANPVVRGCHSLIDPAGFALENFDAIGRWRTSTNPSTPIDASGALPDGTKFDGVPSSARRWSRRPERFVTTVTEKLLTYALGRGLEYYDMPAVRRIVREAAQDGYRFQSIVRRRREELSVLRWRRVAAPTTTSAAVTAIEDLSHDHHQDALPRRTFLRGLGATVALPLLDAMVPALSPRPDGGERRVLRLGFFYVPNGMFLPNFHPAGTAGARSS